MSHQDRPEEDDESLGTEAYLRAYHFMALSRAFDERGNALARAGTPVPHFHSGIGQEALAVGPVLGLRQSDQLVYTHRGCAQLLAKGVPLREILLDAYVKRGGTNNGLGGILHVSRPDLGVPGREGIFGTRFGISAGLALASQLDGRNDVTHCFYGEAAGARGPLYEALNMAVLWKLPLVLIAENNGWSVSSRTEWLFPDGRLSRVWRGFDIPVEEVDGNDIEAVYAAARRAVTRARSGAGPSVIEGITYRLDPHVYKDEAAYQPKEEIARWREKDPLRRARTRLRERDVPETEIERIERAAEQEVDTAFHAAEQAPDARWADNLEVIGR